MTEREFEQDELLEMLDGGLGALGEVIVSLMDGKKVSGEELGMSYMQFALPASLLAHRLTRQGEEAPGLKQLVENGPQLDMQIQVFLQQPSREGLQQVASAFMAAREGGQMLIDSL